MNQHNYLMSLIDAKAEKPILDIFNIISENHSVNYVVMTD